MTTYGYARYHQRPGLAAQDAELDGRRLRQGVSGEGLGAKTDRAELAKLIKRLELGTCSS